MMNLFPKYFDTLLIVLHSKIMTNPKLHVANINPTSKRADLLRLFRSFGELENENIKYSSGYCFLQYKFMDNAKDALKNIPGTQFNGKTLSASLANNQKWSDCAHTTNTTTSAGCEFGRHEIDKIMENEFRYQMVWVLVNDNTEDVQIGYWTSVFAQNYPVYYHVMNIKNISRFILNWTDNIKIVYLPENNTAIGWVDGQMIKNLVSQNKFHLLVGLNWIDMFSPSEIIRRLLGQCGDAIYENDEYDPEVETNKLMNAIR